MLLPLRGVGGVWVPFTQGAALGYVLLPLRGVLFISFDTLSYVIVGLSCSGKRQSRAQPALIEF